MSKTLSRNLQRRREKRRKAKVDNSIDGKPKIVKSLPVSSIANPEKLPGHRKGGTKKLFKRLERVRTEGSKRSLIGGHKGKLRELREAVERGQLTREEALLILRGQGEIPKPIEEIETETPEVNIQDRLSDIRSRKEVQRTERKNSVVEDGFLYLVTSPAYPEWVKVGQTSDFEKRLSAYQTASPHADYSMVEVKYVENRVEAESKLLEMARLVFEVKGEWVKASVEDLVLNF
jgi:hypothetical protein